MSTQQHISRRRFLALCLASGLGMRVSTALAAVNPRVIVLLSGNEAPYRQAFAALRAALIDLPLQVQLPTEALPLQADALLITLGQKAAQQAAQQKFPGQVLAALIPEAANEAIVADLPDDMARRWSALVLDQPWARQLALTRKVLPKAAKLGLVYSNGSAGDIAGMRVAASRLNLALDARQLKSEAELFPTLRQMLDGVDAMLAIPDAQVINRSTLQGYLLSAYRANVPVIAYSQALVEAGALAGVFSTPEDVGLDLADLLSRPSQGRIASLSRLTYPRRFSLKINHSVARSLGLVMPDEEQLRRQLESASGS